MSIRAFGRKRGLAPDPAASRRRGLETHTSGLCCAEAAAASASCCLSHPCPRAAGPLGAAAGNVLGPWAALPLAVLSVCRVCTSLHRGWGDTAREGLGQSFLAPTAPLTKATQLVAATGAVPGQEPQWHGRAQGSLGQGDKGTLRPLVRDPSHGMESNSSENCTTSQHCTVFTKHLRKLPFWNKNTSQDKACLLAVPQLRRARVTTHPQGDGRSQRAFWGRGGSCWRQEQGGSGQPVAQPWHRAGGTSSPRSPRCALRQ